MRIDLRSDTVTKPTPGMLDAMMHAKVGDDVFGEDPTIVALENRLADMFGMEAGLYCPSGTMTNQIAIKAHTQPLDEIICDQLAHIYNYETGGWAFHSGVSIKLIQTERGIIQANQVTSFDVSNLATGYYFLESVDGDIVFRERFVVEN